MKSLILPFLAAAALAPKAPAAESPTITPCASNSYILEWQGAPDRIYFVQYSFDLINWQCFPVVEQGTGDTLSYGFDSSSPMQFLRLAWLDPGTLPDTDGDGLPDPLEVIWGTDPYLQDSDANGIGDLEEFLDALYQNPYYSETDYDMDGIPDWLEAFLGTDPSDPDSDGDGLTDLMELLFTLTDPTSPDSDGDNTPDGQEDPDCDNLDNLEEMEHGTNPHDWDSDGDNLGDGGEIDAGTNPLDGQSADTDNDGIADSDEVDSDCDGIPDAVEITIDTDPLDSDSNGDGLPDGDEDNDGDGYTDGTEVDQGTDPLDYLDKPAAELLILTGSGGAGVRTSKHRNVTLPADGPLSYIAVVAMASAEYPTYTGDPSTEFDDLLEWRIISDWVTVADDNLQVYSLHGAWDIAAMMGETWQGLDPVHFKFLRIINRTPGQPLQVELEASATNIIDAAYPSTIILALLPIQPIELSPALLDDDDQIVTDSTVPTTEPGRTNAMVEQNPVTNRIAHRHVKVKIPDAEFLANREITWSMTPLFTNAANTTPHFRRMDWWNQSQVADHRNRFESSAPNDGDYDGDSEDDGFEAYAFELEGQTGATTGFDTAIESAVRVNLPPIGFNKARVALEIAGVDGDPANLLDFEVQAVVVIDPGHGDTDDGNSPLFTLGDTTTWRPKERDMVMDMSDRLVGQIRQSADATRGMMRAKVTRADNSVPLPSHETRRYDARDWGADVFLSVHFNDKGDVGEAPQSDVRGTQVYIRQESDNVNWNADSQLGEAVGNAAIQAAAGFNNQQFQNTDYQGEPEPFPHTQAGSWGDLVRGSGFAVLSEAGMQQASGYAPLRAALLEVDYLDHWDIDWLYNRSAVQANVRQTFATTLSPAIINHIRNAP